MCTLSNVEFWADLSFMRCVAVAVKSPGRGAFVKQKTSPTTRQRLRNKSPTQPHRHQTKLHHKATKEDDTKATHQNKNPASNKHAMSDAKCWATKLTTPRHDITTNNTSNHIAKFSKPQPRMNETMQRRTKILHKQSNTTSRRATPQTSRQHSKTSQ